MPDGEAIALVQDKAKPNCRCLDLGKTEQRRSLAVHLDTGHELVHVAAAMGVAGPHSGCVAPATARHLVWKLQDGGLKVIFLLRDRDAKFIASFDEVFKSQGVSSRSRGPA